MLSVFPELLFLSPFAALLIRVALALLIAYDGWHVIARGDTWARFAGASSILLAGLLLVGAWTQPMALILAFSFIIYLAFPSLCPPSAHTTLPRSSILLAIVMALSLVLTGPGAFAFDLPL